MTDQAAYPLAILIASAVVADFVFTGGDNLLFLSRKFMDLISWLTFWR